MRRLTALLATLLLGACQVAAPSSPVVTPEATPPVGTPAPTPSPSPGQAGPSSPATPEPIAGGVREVRSSADRAPAGSVDPRSVQPVVAADTELALALYRGLAASEDGNVFLSPYSISTALSMTLAGARGNTEEELGRALGAIGLADWHAARNAIELGLLGERRGADELTPLTLEPTNAIFGQDGFEFEEAFLDTLAAFYGAGMQLVDFAGATEAARLTINEWVKERTGERIEELLPPDSVNELTRFALVNAIYFKANWINQFEPEQTRDEPFMRLDGSRVDVPTMHSVPTTVYGSGDGWQAVALPYAGQASMLILVPDQGDFASVEEELDATLLGAVRDSLERTEVTLSLPRWETTSDVDLIPLLKSLGVHDLFSSTEADLTGMSPRRDGWPSELHVTEALHQASITVDESGTEAAAATAIVGGFTSAPPEATLDVDRPFIYFIQDDLTGEILFLGRVLDPSAD